MAKFRPERQHFFLRRKSLKASTFLTTHIIYFLKAYYFCSICPSHCKSAKNDPKQNFAYFAEIIRNDKLQLLQRNDQKRKYAYFQKDDPKQKCAYFATIWYGTIICTKKIPNDVAMVTLQQCTKNHNLRKSCIFWKHTIPLLRLSLVIRLNRVQNYAFDSITTGLCTMQCHYLMDNINHLFSWLIDFHDETFWFPWVSLFLPTGLQWAVTPGGDSDVFQESEKVSTAPTSAF